MGIRCADHVTPLYPQKFALTSPTGGGCSVGIVRSRTKATKFSFNYIRTTNSQTSEHQVKVQGRDCQTTEKFQANKATVSERDISLAIRRLLSKVYPLLTIDILSSGYTSTTTLSSVCVCVCV